MVIYVYMFMCKEKHSVIAILSNSDALIPNSNKDVMPRDANVVLDENTLQRALTQADKNTA